MTPGPRRRGTTASRRRRTNRAVPTGPERRPAVAGGPATGRVSPRGGARPVFSHGPARGRRSVRAREVLGHQPQHHVEVPGDQRVQQDHVFGRVGGQVRAGVADGTADEGPLRPPVQVVRDPAQLLVAGQTQHRPVEGPVGLRVRGRAAGGRRPHGILRQRPQRRPPLRRHRPGQPQHHRDLDQLPHLRQLGQLARPALHHPEPAVGHHLDGALQGELLHGLPHGRGRDPEALREHRRRVHLARPQLPGDQRRAQRLQDLSAHRGPPHRGPLGRGRRLGDRPVTPRELVRYGLRRTGVRLACRALGARRALLRRHPRTALRPGGALHAVLHRVLLAACRYLGSLTVACRLFVKHLRHTERQVKLDREKVREGSPHQKARSPGRGPGRSTTSSPSLAHRTIGNTNNRAPEAA
ncbi:conserved hypothetical protein [Streptomyces misionensis JCM 4497]